MAARVLIVDHRKKTREGIEKIHREAGWETKSAATLREALALLERAHFDVVYLDLEKPDHDGIDALGEIRQKKPHQIVVILTTKKAMTRAVEAADLGAFDVVERNCGAERLLLTSKIALTHRTLVRENRHLKERAGGVPEFLGTSHVAREIVRLIGNVSQTASRVLISGESGTGRELIARSIHDHSDRRDGPFVKVNCAAIPHELMETELFGRASVANTVPRRKGKFQAADGGTLFLAEVDEMGSRVQERVLRALREGKVQSSANDPAIAIDVRVIASTSRHLGEEVAAGHFGEDLYRELNGVPIVSPPLAERVEDVLPMAEAFIHEYCARHDIPRKSLDPEVIERLRRYPWPGNARELRNQIERMVFMCPGRAIQLEDVSAEVRAGVPSALMTRRGERLGPEPEVPEMAMAAPVADGADAVHSYLGLPMQEARRRFEHDIIVQALEVNDWNVSRAADELGLERTNLHKKIKTMGIQRR